MFYHQLLDKMPKEIQGMINLNSNNIEWLVTMTGLYWLAQTWCTQCLWRFLKKILKELQCVLISVDICVGTASWLYCHDVVSSFNSIDLTRILELKFYGWSWEYKILSSARKGFMGFISETPLSREENNNIIIHGKLQAWSYF